MVEQACEKGIAATDFGEGEVSKIGNHYQALRETEDYQFGWESAERGEPLPDWPDPKPSIKSQIAQRLGWQDYHDQERQP